jgi:metal-responsive CopG/Arc/MetJ family transcriptional regulator
MMRRALVGFTDEDLHQLDTLSALQHVSRSELIRQAVATYLDNFKPAISSEDAFGLWQARKTDGLVYQEKLREEW